MFPATNTKPFEESVKTHTKRVRDDLQAISHQLWLAGNSSETVADQLYWLNKTLEKFSVCQRVVNELIADLKKGTF